MRAGPAQAHPAAARLLRDRTAVCGLLIVGAVGLAALLAPVLAPHDPNAQDVAAKLSRPSWAFPLGRDELGRDVLSRILYGARLSLGTTLVVAAGTLSVGTVLGLLAGFLGGPVDAVISRAIDVLLAFPTFLLALAVLGTLGPGLGRLTAALVAVLWAGYARIVRAAALAEREQLYVEAARAQGAGPVRLLARHVLPNVAGPLVVLATLDLGAVMLGLSALSFLGLGAAQPTAEWGAMLAHARAFLRAAPGLSVAPGLAIFVTVLGFNLLGDGIRDALDPLAEE